eukprot:scaffold49935_cov29-Attheya_sp.AAC.1
MKRVSALRKSVLRKILVLAVVLIGSRLATWVSTGMHTAYSIPIALELQTSFQMRWTACTIKKLGYLKKT